MLSPGVREFEQAEEEDGEIGVGESFETGEKWCELTTAADVFGASFPPSFAHFGVYDGDGVGPGPNGAGGSAPLGLALTGLRLRWRWE